MTKRKPKYEEMSDFEISANVLLLILDDDACGMPFPTTYSDSKAGIDKSNGATAYFDFNNPSDAWPIIVSNKICLQWYEDGHGIYASASMATSDESNNSFISDDENPLRAAMICFLKIKEQTND